MTGAEGLSEERVPGAELLPIEETATVASMPSAFKTACNHKLPSSVAGCCIARMHKKCKAMPDMQLMQQAWRQSMSAE